MGQSNPESHLQGTKHRRYCQGIYLTSIRIHVTHKQKQIAIPYSSILEVERSSAMDFSETIEVKVFDKEGNYSVDSYFFAYFHNLSAALEQIRDAVRNVRSLPEQEQPQILLDTTVVRSSATASSLDRSDPSSEVGSAKSSFSGFRLSSLLRPLSETISISRSSGVSSNTELSIKSEDFTHVTRRTNSFVPFTDSPKSVDPPALPSPLSREQTEEPLRQQTQPVEHTYPPSISRTSIVPDLPSFRSSSWGVGVPSWLRTRRMFGGITSSSQGPLADGGVKEVYSTPTLPSAQSSKGGWGDMAFSILETPNITVDTEMTEKFRTAFAYDEKETLLGCMLRNAFESS